MTYIAPLTLPFDTLASKLEQLPGFAWLDSNAPAHTLGRFSILTGLPVARYLSERADASLLPPATRGRATGAIQGATEALPPPTPGLWIGWVAFAPPQARAELGRWQTPNPRAEHTPPAQSDTGPYSDFAYYPAFILVDHHSGLARICAENRAAADRLLDGLRSTGNPQTRQRTQCTRVETAPAADFCASVVQAQQHMTAGNVYLVNLARAWHIYCDAFDVNALWQEARRRSPVPLGFRFHGHAETVLLGRSMELGLETWTGPAGINVRLRPIKGTRPLAGASTERAFAALACDPKERAEHTMLVDLLRNDIGKLALPGTVTWPEVFKCEQYTHLVHAVSTVTGTLPRTTNLETLVRNMLPMGSVSGTPKSSALSLIDTLETHPRHTFGGLAGYIDARGNSRFAINIRSAFLSGDSLLLQAGSGLVIDSDAEAEAAETELKVRFFFEALRALAP